MPCGDLTGPSMHRCGNPLSQPQCRESYRRLVFTDVASKEAHIRRSTVADVYLDTPWCNAHTSGCDVLWAGRCWMRQCYFLMSLAACVCVCQPDMHLLCRCAAVAPTLPFFSSLALCCCAAPQYPKWGPIAERWHRTCPPPGVPMVTMPLHRMASRVAASLCCAAGCPELVVASPAEYEELAGTIGSTGGPPRQSVGESARAPGGCAGGKGGVLCGRLALLGAPVLVLGSLCRPGFRCTWTLLQCANRPGAEAFIRRACMTWGHLFLQCALAPTTGGGGSCEDGSRGGAGSRPCSTRSGGSGTLRGPSSGECDWGAVGRLGVCCGLPYCGVVMDTMIIHKAFWIDA